MMRFRALAFAVAVALSLSPGTATAQPQAPRPDWSAFDQYVAKAARDWKVPGLAIAVVSGDSLVFARGYGVAELGKPAPVTEHTRFAAASTTKAITAAAVAMLVDDGKLNLDDRVIDWIPELRLYDPYATRELTIRDLLTHRTGLPNTDLLWATQDNQYSGAEIIRRLRFVKPVSSFRSSFLYQNVTYSIAGHVIERASGMPWAAFVRTRIFAPLGMTESVPLVADIRGAANVASPHELVGDTLVRVVPLLSTDAIAPAGSAWTSVSDMSKWMRFVLDSGRVGTARLIKPATFRELVAPQIRAPLDFYPALSLAQPHFFTYALGWFVQDYGGRTVWMHTGSIDGLTAIIGLLPAQKVGVYILGNLDHAEVRHALMYQVFDLYGAGPDRDWSGDLKALFAARRKAAAADTARHVSGTRASLPLDRYAGTYMDSTYGVVEITNVGGVLHGRFEKTDLGPLDQWEYDTFRTRPSATPGDLSPWKFALDAERNVTAVTGYGVTFTRVPNR